MILSIYKNGVYINNMMLSSKYIYCQEMNLPQREKGMTFNEVSKSVLARGIPPNLGNAQ